MIIAIVGKPQINVILDPIDALKGTVIGPLSAKSGG